jgi:hypothetical protein
MKRRTELWVVKPTPTEGKFYFDYLVPVDPFELFSNNRFRKSQSFGQRYTYISSVKETLEEATVDCNNRKKRFMEWLAKEKTEIDRMQRLFADFYDTQMKNITAVGPQVPSPYFVFYDKKRKLHGFVVYQLKNGQSIPYRYGAELTHRSEAERMAQNASYAINTLKTVPEKLVIEIEKITDSEAKYLYSTIRVVKKKLKFVRPDQPSLL